MGQIRLFSRCWSGAQWRSQRSFQAVRQLSSSSGDGPALNSSMADLPKEAEVVVIGGGAVGTGLTYHLSKQLSNTPGAAASTAPGVVLLEKSELTAGSTWHAAGLTTSFHFGMNFRRVHWESLLLYAQLERETGQAIGYHRPGSIRLAETPTRMDEFRQQLGKASWYPAPARIIDPDEMLQKCPLMNTDGILGGFYTPFDGYVDPYSVTMAMGAGAKQNGAKIFTNSEVTGIESTSNKDSIGRWTVTTTQGSIRCRHVVNACGFWGRELDALHERIEGHEQKLPLIPVHHQYCITNTLPEVQALSAEIPVMRDLEGSYYLRMERDGLLVGPYEAPERMKLQEDWLLDKVTPGFGRELFDNDLERIGPYLEAAVNRFPAFGKAPIIQTVAGPITYAPDGLPMVGPKPGYPGMWLAVGFGYGIIHAGGIGRYLGDWMRHGYPPYDLTEADPGRFSVWSDDPKFIMDRTRETYGMNNSYSYVKEERKGGRPTQRAGPLYSHLQERGANFGFKVGYEVPLWFERPNDVAGYHPSFHRTNWFSPVGRESQLVRDSVGVVDLSSFATFRVAGEGSRAFLSRIFANRIPKTTGKSCLAHMLLPNGRVLSEMTVTCTTSGAAPEYLLVTGGGSELHDLRWMQEQLAASQQASTVSITNTSDSLACLGVAGPKSPQLMARLFPDGGAFSRDAWSLLSHRVMTRSAGAVALDVMRISYTGELGWEIHCPMSAVAGLYQDVHKLGADLGVEDFGMYAMNSLRMEKGFRAWGAELSKDNTIVEAGMMSFVRDASKESLPFVGHDAVQSELQRGSKEQLVMLRVLEDDGKTDPDGSEPIYCEGKVVGHVSSGCYGYQAGHGLAFGYVTPYVADAGTELDIMVIGKMHRCVVMPTSPVPADHLR